MKLSVYTLLFRQYTLKEIAKMLHRIGYDGIEIRVAEDGVHLPLDVDLIKLEEVKKLIKSYGFEIPCISSYCKLGYPGERGELELLKMEKVAKIAKFLEAPFFRIQTANYNPQLGYERMRELIRKQIEEAYNRIHRAGIEVIPVIEQHGISCLSSSAGILIDLLRGISPEKIGVLYDPGNAIHEGWERPEIQIDILREYIKHVHVKNYDRTPENPHKPIPSSLDKGILDWIQIIKTLKGIGYEGYLSLEDFRPIPPEEKAKEAIKFLKNVIKSL